MVEDDGSVMHKSASGARSVQSDCMKCTGLQDPPSSRI